MVRYGSVCSGIECVSVGWLPLGWTPVFFAEIEPFPSSVLAKHYPHVPNLGDFTKIHEPPAIDVLVGGTPCFPGDVLIATRRGLLPIQSVIVGDEVLTHMSRWRRVLAIGSKSSATVCLKGQGQSDGLITTAEHPFYARQKRRVWVGRDAGSWVSRMDDVTWVSAKDMQGKFWASPMVWPVARPPRIVAEGRESSVPSMSPELAWVIGRWVGDGWTRINNRRGYVMICSAFNEADELAARLRAAGLAFTQTKERTTARFAIASRAFARWLRDEFGAGAASKSMPTWVFGWKYRSELLAGYISADGNDLRDGWRLTTVSRGLALGAVLLAHSLGFSASRSLSHPRRKQCFIEGRLVNELPSWTVSIYRTARSSVAAGEHRWGCVRSVEACGEAEVFNLEVAEDNSYVADGMVVHNCQDFSIAGLREGLAGDDGNLALEFLRLVDRARPRWVVWENVPGVLSSLSHHAPSEVPPQDDVDLESLALGETRVVEDEYDADESHAFGCFVAGLSELGYGVAWRVIDAQYTGVPQRRRRVFVVGHLGDWAPAAAVLLERASLRGDSPPSRETGTEVAGSLGGGPGERGWCDDFERSGAFIPEVANSLQAQAQSAQTIGLNRHRTGALRAQNTPVIAFDLAQVTSKENRSNPKPGGPAPSLAETSRPALAFHHQQDPISDEVSMPLEAGAAGMGCLTPRGLVRRLTPREAERLMGLPDDYTKVDEDTADGPRYRACGNGIVTHCVKWIAQRIELVEAALKETS